MRNKSLAQPMAMQHWLIVSIAVAVYVVSGTARAQEPNVPGQKAKTPLKFELPAAPTHKATYAQEYAHSFKGDRDLAPEFHWHGLEPQSCAAFEPTGMRLTLPLGHPERRMGTGVGLNTLVKGDFEITMRYEMLKEPTPAETAAGTGVFIWVDLNKPKMNRGFVARAMTGNGKRFTTWYHLTPDPPAKPIDISRQFPAKDAGGQLRIVRTGSTLYYYAAEASGKFSLLQQHPFGAEDLQAVRWGGQTGGPDAGLDARFIDLRIRADALPDLANTPNPAAAVPIDHAPGAGVQSSRSGWLAALLIAGFGVTLLLAGAAALFLVLRQRGALRKT